MLRNGHCLQNTITLTAWPNDDSSKTLDNNGKNDNASNILGRCSRNDNISDNWHKMAKAQFNNADRSTRIEGERDVQQFIYNEVHK